MTSRHAEYKRENVRTWNEIAPRYHRRWAGEDGGPWKSSDKLVGLSGIKRGDAVLDVACGTGAVTCKIRDRVGDGGLVVGIDTSAAAIKIARRCGRRRGNVGFVNCDAERFGFSRRFDVVTCQYALFFFPDSRRALRNMAGSLRRGGILGVSVHGSNTPYYTSITDAVAEFIPDYLPGGPARLDRFGRAPELRREIRAAGFTRVSVREFIFSFSPGTFDDYWRSYRRYVAGPAREKLGGLPRRDLREIRARARRNTLPYTGGGGRIAFPWQVLIATARAP